jgi:hypothetical protein
MFCFVLLTTWRREARETQPDYLTPFSLIVKPNLTPFFAPRNQQGDYYKAGQWIGFGQSILMMGANGITNAVAQMGKNRNVWLGLRRLVYDNRSWRQVRGMWSGSGNYLSSNRQNLHHVIFPQRWGTAQGGWIPNGIVNAGLNYAPTTAWVNQVTLNPYAWKGGAAAEWAFRAGFVTQFSPLGNAFLDLFR